MKKIFFKSIAAAVLTVGLTGCVNDLDISSIDPQSSPSADPMGVLAKCYSTLGLTGQAGPAGKGDLSDDEGESGFYRTTFNLQELPTDECAWAWQDNPDIPQLTYMQWNSSSVRVGWAYTRLTYDITLFNSYLQQVEDNEANRLYRAEVRFLRALHYWYLLDLFGKVPFKTEFNITDLPVEYTAQQIYDWIDKELTEIEPMMAEVGTYSKPGGEYGRADRGAAYLLHARLALNSETYTGKPDYDKAIEYCNKLEQSRAYELSTRTNDNGYTGYEQLFMADNDENEQAMRETILPIRQDGARTRNYGGSTYLVLATRISGMPDVGLAIAPWSCLFARKSMVDKFFPAGDIPMSTEEAPAGASEAEIKALDMQDGSSTDQITAAAGDDRALFYAGRGGGIRKNGTDAITTFTDGISIVKWSNIRSDNGRVSDTSWPDTDIPLFRYAEMYLIRAEAKWRKSGNLNDALADINVLRDRAHATRLLSINSEMDILDEWCREFYLEGRRRSDLRRFDCFTGNKYLWDWKGGSATGTNVYSHYDVYPFPDTDLNNNSNLTPTPGY